MRSHCPGGDVVGPNAILQSAEALRAEGGVPLMREVFARAGLDHMVRHPPETMVAEGDAAALHRAIRDTLDPDRAETVAREAGRLTGDYILAHRIPPRAQAALRALPAGLAGRMLLIAIKRHAWTFAGSGKVSITAFPMTLAITGNPLAAPGCPWHCAVLQTLFRRLVEVETEVRVTTCDASGDRDCRFHIDRPHAAKRRPPRPGRSGPARAMPTRPFHR
jgi:divinyl protochlorophyllide a 8-vinyl-reductase